MSSIPLVALAGRSPQIMDYGEQLAQQQQIQALRNRNALAPGELQLQKQQIEGQRMQLDQLHSLLEGNKALVQAQHDPEWDASDPDKFVKIFNRYNVPLPLQMQTAKGLFELREQLTKASKESLEMSDAAHSFFDDQIQGAKSAPPDMREKAYQEALGNVRNYISRFPDGAAKNAGLQELASAPPLYNEAWINQKHGLLKTQKSLLEDALKRAQAREAEGKGLQATAESNLLFAKTPGAAAESTIQQQQAAMTPQQRALAGNLFYGAAGGNAQKALQLETAQKIAAAQAGFANVPAGLKGVAPHLVAPAAAAAEKAGNEYSDAVAAANDMKTFVDLAKAGNKVAYAYSPTEGVLTLNTARGVKRVNMAEISSYGGAGSAADRVMGFLGKQTKGASIPESVLNDMQSLHQSIAANAKRTYANKLKNTNQTYGSNFQPVEMGASQEPTANSGKVLSLAAIQQAAKDHGVSVDEAKRQAIAAGYTIQ